MEYNQTLDLYLYHSNQPNVYCFDIRIKAFIPVNAPLDFGKVGNLVLHIGRCPDTRSQTVTRRMHMISRVDSLWFPIFGQNRHAMTES